MLNGIAIFSTAPMAAFLTLHFELLLCLGIGESKKELDTIALNEQIVEVFDQLFRNLTRLEAVLFSERLVYAACRLTERTQPLY